MSSSDVFSLISAIDSIILLFVAGIGIYLTVRQLRQGYEVQKATFFKELYMALTSHTDIRKAVYMVEGKRFVFDQNFYGSPEEYLIDQMLSFFDLVCELYTRTMLTNQEMQFFKYEALTVYNDDGIQKYLEIPYRILCNSELQKNLGLGLAWLHTFTFLAVTQNSVWHRI